MALLSRGINIDSIGYNAKQCKNKTANRCCSNRFQGAPPITYTVIVYNRSLYMNQVLSLDCKDTKGVIINMQTNNYCQTKEGQRDKQ
jgi:hypothetical protein